MRINHEIIQGTNLTFEIQNKYTLLVIYKTNLPRNTNDKIRFPLNNQTLPFIKLYSSVLFTLIFIGNCGRVESFSLENNWKSVGINSFGAGKWSSGIISHVSHAFTNPSGKYSCLYGVPNHFSFSVTMGVKSLLARNTLEEEFHECGKRKWFFVVPHFTGNEIIVQYFID